MTLWTEEQTEFARKLWREGLSAREVSKRLDPPRSRNAVIGRMHRIGEATHARAHASRPRKPYVVRTQPKPVKTNRGAHVRSIQNRLNAGTFAPRAPKPPREPWSYTPNVVSLAEPAALLIPLLDLKASHCRWPIIGEGADTAFCGHSKADGSSYCAFHKARSINPQAPTKIGQLMRDLRRFA